MNHSANLEVLGLRPTAGPDPEALASERRGTAVTAAISDAVGRIFRDYLGRGPTRTRASIRDNVVVVVLEDTLTKAEKTLAAGGQVEPILHMRRTFQRTMREPLCDAVADLTGRPVIAFMGDNHTDPDYAVEVFVLESLPTNGGPAGAERA